MGEKQQNTKKSVSGKAFDWTVLSKVILYARPYKWQTIISLFLSVALGLLATARPILIRNGVDYAIVEDGNRRRTSRVNLQVRRRWMLRAR